MRLEIKVEAGKRKHCPSQNDIAILINKFKNLGYEITVQGDSLKYKYIGNGHPSRDGYTFAGTN